MKTILVCDDERHMVRLIEHTLKRSGHRVLTANTGKEALALLASEPIDLLILDVMLPGQDGFSILAEMRQKFGDKSPIVVMLTARGQTTTREQAEALDVALFVTKPFSPIELLQNVQKLLG